MQSLRLIPLVFALGCVNYSWMASSKDLVTPFHCVTNQGPKKATVLAQARFEHGQMGNTRDGAAIRSLDVRQPKPGERTCFRWPWISEVGRIGIVQGSDTTWGPWFNPWEPKPRKPAP